MGVTNPVVVIWLFIGIKFVTSENLGSNGDYNDDKFGSWHKNQRIINDVSVAIYKNQTENLHTLFDFSNSSESINQFFYFYELKANISNQTCSWNTADGQDVPVSCKKIGVTGVSLILNKKAKQEDIRAISLPPLLTNNTIASLFTMNHSFIHSVIFSVDSSSQSCNSTHPDFIDLFQNYRTVFQGPSIRMGLEYNERFLDYCGQLSRKISGFVVNDVILKVELTPLTTMLSYAVFSDMMSKTVQKFRQCISQSGYNGTVYIRLIISNWDGAITEEYYDRYEALVHRFFLSWSKEDPGNEMIIVRPSPAKQVDMLGNRQFLKENVMGVNFKYQEYKYKYKQSKDIPRWSCEPQVFKNIIFSLNDEIFFADPTLTAFESMSDDCLFEKEGKYLNQAAVKEGNVSLYLHNNDENQNENDKDFKQLRDIIVSNDIDQENEDTIDSKPNAVNIRSVYFGDFNFLAWQGNTSDAINLTSFIKSRNISVGCTFWINDTVDAPQSFEEIAERVCGPMVQIADQFICAVHVGKQNADLIKFLRNFQQSKQQFEKVYDKKMIMPYFILLTDKYQELSQIYCDPEIQRRNRDSQTILSFANIHHWKKLVLLPHSSVTLNSINDQLNGLWQSVETDSSVDQSATRFPVFVRTNSKEPEDDKFPFTFPCLNWTQNATQKINFFENSNLATTFVTTLRLKTALSSREMKTLLAFALERFPAVDVIAIGKEGFRLVESVLSGDIMANINRFRESMGGNANPTLVYVEVPISIFRSLWNDVAELTGRNNLSVHISGWECEQSNSWKSEGSTPPFNIGLTVQDCGHEMNTGLARLKKLPFIDSIKYIVCNVKSVVPHNVDKIWMQKYLGTLYYTKVYMENFLPSLNSTQARIDVMFRINLNSKTKRCSDRDLADRERFLRFYGDLTQHSKIYDMKYFIVRAFETNEVADECQYSWWRIEDYSDLTNTSVYVDVEHEYFGSDTTLNVTIPPDDDEVNESEDSGINLMYLLNIPFFLVFTLVIVILWVKLRRTRKQFLSYQEMHDFYNGAKAIGDGIEMENATCYDPIYTRFQNQYEIPAKDIAVAELIGSGQFGVVHKGVLQKEVGVAIKIPRSDCGVEQFKSSLSELKMHCYIGTHQNIVCLLGAYTKEIISGKLYIVLELCEMGSLQSYLRRQQSAEKGEDASSSVDLNQLCGFGHQIACGMEHLSGKRVIHGDLATRNVLLTSDFTCKIADFGLSRRLYEMSEYRKTSREPLPWRWMAVESLKNMEFTTKSDVWSYGVTLWEIFSLGMVPYPGRSWTNDFVTELDNGMRMGKAEHASEEIHGIMLKCWNILQEERPDFAELIQFFVGIRNQEYTNMEDGITT